MDLPDHNEIWSELEKKKELQDDLNNMDSKAFFKKYQEKFDQQEFKQRKNKNTAKSIADLIKQP